MGVLLVLLDDDFHLATMMDVWLVFFHLATMMGVWLVFLWLVFHIRMLDEHTEQRSGNKECFQPQLEIFEALALKGTKLILVNLTLDDDFHLATMMGVWLVFSHYDGCLVSVH